MLPLALCIVAGIAVLLPASLPYEARMALFIFAGRDPVVHHEHKRRLRGARGAHAPVLTGGSPQEKLFDALASDVVWLMIGAFVLGGAMRATGLAGRLTGFVVERASSVRGLMWMPTTVLIPLSFVIPSTSGRAAVVMPVFRSITERPGTKRSSGRSPC